MCVVCVPAIGRDLVCMPVIGWITSRLPPWHKEKGYINKRSGAQLEEKSWYLDTFYFESSPGFKLRTDDKLYDFPELSHTDARTSISDECLPIYHSDFNIKHQEKILNMWNYCHQYSVFCALIRSISSHFSVFYTMTHSPSKAMWILRCHTIFFWLAALTFRIIKTLISKNILLCPNLNAVLHNIQMIFKWEICFYHLSHITLAWQKSYPSVIQV